MIDKNTSLQDSTEYETATHVSFLTWTSFLVFVGISLSTVISAYIFYLNQPPESFESNTVVSIETGESVRAITQKLADANVAKSEGFLYLIIALFGEPENIKASTYVFEEPVTAITLAKQLAEGDFDSNLVRFTHIEGERNELLAERAAETLPLFDENEFLELAANSEGRMFPETYFVPADYTAKDLYELMLETFNASLGPYEEEILNHSLSLEEIIILASIIEREARSEESMKLVSGILQNRLAIGMPLQADASIEYILDKPLSELTPADLEINSPYNTYLNIGLPPTAIGNPGLAAIKAVITPTESDYFYYITDDNGVFHYAKTYREHLNNIDLYLR